MSRENVELLRRMDDAFRRMDLDALLALHDPECEISPLIVGEDRGAPYRGHAGIREFVGDLEATFLELLPERTLIHDLGETLVVRLHFRGRPQTGEEMVDTVAWQAMEIRDGLAQRWVSYRSEAEALEAAGVSE